MIGLFPLVKSFPSAPNKPNRRVMQLTLGLGCALPFFPAQHLFAPSVPQTIVPSVYAVIADSDTLSDSKKSFSFDAAIFLVLLTDRAWGYRDPPCPFRPLTVPVRSPIVQKNSLAGGKLHDAGPLRIETGKRCQCRLFSVLHATVMFTLLLCPLESFGVVCAEFVVSPYCSID